LLALSTDVSRPARDVTSIAIWTVSGTVGGTISPSGVVTAQVEGVVEVYARFEGQAATTRLYLWPSRPGQVLAAVRGHVYAEAAGDLHPISGATVEILNAIGAGPSTESDATGAYQFDAVTPGAVLVRASKAGYAPTDLSIDIYPGENHANLLVEPPRDFPNGWRAFTKRADDAPAAERPLVLVRLHSRRPASDIGRDSRDLECDRRRTVEEKRRIRNRRSGVPILKRLDGIRAG
jgi:hypothetical protein